MKTLLFILSLAVSTSAFAQQRFKVPSDTRRLTSLQNTIDNHQIILKTYKTLLDSQIKRLATGIQYESLVKSNEHKLRYYEQLLVNLFIKRIVIKKFQDQLSAVDLTNGKGALRLDSENIKIDLAKELDINIKDLPKKDFGHYFLEDLKVRILKETLSTIAVNTYQAVGSGLLAKIVANGAGQAALKGAFVSIGSQAFINVARGSILSLLTIPLHGYRLPPETMWTDILEKNPELIINPEWMKYGGCKDDPWYTHGYALLRSTDRMERALTRFLDNEEKDFQLRVIQISNMVKIVPIKKTEPSTKYPLKYEYPTMAVDGTYVHRNNLAPKIAPFWADKIK